MKGKTLQLLTLLLSMVLWSGCAVSTMAGNDVLYEKGLEVVKKMDSMAESKEYIRFMAALPEIENTLEDIGSGDYSVPRAVYQVIITPAEIDMLLESVGGDLSQLSEELLLEIRNRMVASIPSRINGLAGVSSLAATTAVAAQDNFIEDTQPSYALYFYLYDEAYPAAVSFVPGGENIVTANGYFIINEDLTEVTSEEKFVEWLRETAGLIDCTVEEITIGQ